MKRQPKGSEKGGEFAPKTDPLFYGTYEAAAEDIKKKGLDVKKSKSKRVFATTDEDLARTRYGKGSKKQGNYALVFLKPGVAHDLNGSQHDKYVIFKRSIPSKYIDRIEIYEFSSRRKKDKLIQTMAEELCVLVELDEAGEYVIVSPDTLGDMVRNFMETVLNGGKGSGNYGHKGRPGKIGGSTDRDMPEESKPGLRERGVILKKDDQHLRYQSEEFADELYEAKYADAEKEFEKIKKKTGAYGDMTFDEFATNTFEWTDPETGYRTELDSAYGVTSSRRLEPHVRLEGTIYDKNGKRIGDFSRMLMHDGTIENHEFYLGLGGLRGKQGNGFGVRFFARSEKAYKAAGVKAITLWANSKVGGYAWARMGFTWNGSVAHDPDIGKTHTAGILSKWKRRYKSTPLPKYLRSKTVFEPWEIAALTGPDGYKIGKQYMLSESTGISWNGIKYLDDSFTGWKIGKAYYKSKGIK